MLQNGVQELAAPAPHAGPKAHDHNVSGNATRSQRFDELFLSHYSLIVRLLARMLGDFARAEDLANEAFLKLFRRPALRDSQANLGGWLYRTAMNLGIDALRSAARRRRYETAAVRADIRPLPEQNGLDQILRTEKQQRVRAVLAMLKPVQAEALLLHVSGHSYRELADSLQIHPSSVGTLLIRAEAEFEKRYLQTYGREEPYELPK